jgi:hypothetical protein
MRIVQLVAIIAANVRTTILFKYPNRNVGQRHGALIIKRHDGEPKPEPPRDLKSRFSHMVGDKKMKRLSEALAGRRQKGTSRHRRKAKK